METEDRLAMLRPGTAPPQSLQPDAAAAELVTPDLSELASTITAVQHTLQQQIGLILERKAAQAAELSQALHYLGPSHQLDAHRQRLDMLRDRLESQMGIALERMDGRIALLNARLHAVSPQETLARGYAIVRTAAGEVVRSAEQVQPQETLHVQVAEGAFTVQATE